MGWLSTGIKIPDTEVLAEMILNCEGDCDRQLRDILTVLDFERGWELIKEVLPGLEKTPARNLVRLLFSNKIDMVIKQLDDKDEITNVIECLGYLASREAVEILVRFLGHKDDMIQLVAAGALKNHTPRLVVPYLVDLLLEGKVPPARVAEVLSEMDYLGQDALLEVYGKAETPVKAQILELLAMCRNPKCQPLVQGALASKEKVLKQAALKAIGDLKFRELWLEVAMCLVDPAWQIRVKALEVLRILRVKECLEIVRPFLNDEDVWVQKGALACISDIEKNGLSVTNVDMEDGQ